MSVYNNVLFFFLTGISSTTSDGGSNTERLSNKLCSSENFTPSKWLTMGRMRQDDPPHCPLVGEYTGVIPDAEGLCAKSYADCNNPEIMFYTVFNCNNVSEVYEEREYRCFGQWKEPETGLVYTYTERRDIKGQECFVGVDIDDDHSMVTEAGANCERGHQPRKYGMTLERQSKCPDQVYKDVPEISVNVGRPVSPKLGNVQRVVIPGLPDESILDEIEREQEDRYYGREKHKKHKKHHREYDDILTNDIPDSYPRSSSDLSIKSSLTCVILMLVIRPVLLRFS